MILARIALLGLLALDPAPLGDKVVALAESKLGQVVGGGKCSDLVAEVLRSAGARMGPDGTYGDPVEELGGLRPGDILRFEDAEFRGSTRERGRVRRWTLVFEAHVAIVTRAEVRGGEVVVELIHQNFRMRGQGEEEGRVVQRMVLNLGRLIEGDVRGDRPVPAGAPSPTPCSLPHPR